MLNEMPPVVVSTKGPSLGDHLDLRNLPLATTPGGRAFAIKALHPSDHEYKVVRGPGSLVPTVAIASDQVETIPFPAGINKAVFVQISNPWVQGQLIFFNDNGTLNSTYTFRNPSLGGTTLTGATTVGFSAVAQGGEVIQTNFQKHRVLSQSVTGEVIAPALADQGTITSVQFTSEPRKTNEHLISLSDSTKFNKYRQMAQLWEYDPEPNVNTLLMGTTAYTSKARDGFYQPLKFDNYQWRNSNDGFVMVTGSNGWIPAYGADVTPAITFPFFLTIHTANAFEMHTLPFTQSDIVGLTIIDGVSDVQSVSIRLRMRQICEFVPYPGSQYAALAEAPLPPDDTSYRMVVEIAGRMKDAYPASYNDLDKLKNVIKSIGSALLPVVDPVLSVVGAMVPGAGPIATLARGAIKGAKAVANSANFKRAVPTTQKIISDYKAENNRLNRERAAMRKLLLSQVGAKAAAAKKRKKQRKAARKLVRKAVARPLPAPKKPLPLIPRQFRKLPPIPQ